MSSSSGDFKRIFQNLFMMVLITVGIFSWIHLFTDWLVLSSALGFTGFLSWIALILGLVPEERKKELQERFDEHVLQSPRTGRVLAVAVVLVVLSLTCTGAVVIDTSRDGVERFLMPEDVGSTEDGWSLPSRSRRKFPVFAPLLFQTERRVKVSGLPSRQVRFGPTRRRPVLVSPDSFYSQPAVLLLPAPVLHEAARQEESSFAIRIQIEDDRPIQIYPYKGTALWVGCEKDVTVPTYRRERWQRELGDFLDTWLRPEATRTRRLAPGHRISVQVFHLENRQADPGGDVVPLITEIVHSIKHVEDFPQEIILDVHG